MQSGMWLGWEQYNKRMGAGSAFAEPAPGKTQRDLYSFHLLCVGFEESE